MTEKQNKCVVLGGSFNPPTRAHKILMESAMEKLHANSGIYVPSSDFYVTRKSNKSGKPNNRIVFTEQERFEMLQAMCDESNIPGITVSRCEYGDTSTGRTLQTLDELQRENIDKTLWFIMGSDKIRIFQRWRTASELLSRHNILWVGHGATESHFMGYEIHRSQLLLQYCDKINFAEQPAETENISSSLFWSQLQTGDDAAYSLLTDNVADIVKRILQERR